MTEFAPGGAGHDATPLDVAYRYLGVQEEGGKPNRGRMIDVWLRFCYIDPEKGSFPWCAAFVSWCCHVGNHTIHKSPSVQRLFDANYKLEVPIAELEPGDVVFHFDKGGNHVGFFVRHLGDGKVQTIDGNTNDLGSREGNAVGTPYRPLSYWHRAIRPRKVQRVT